MSNIRVSSMKVVKHGLESIKKLVEKWVFNLGHEQKPLWQALVRLSVVQVNYLQEFYTLNARLLISNWFLKQTFYSYLKKIM